MEEYLDKKKESLLQLKEQLKANLNVVIGQLALLEEIEKQKEIEDKENKSE